ncbi:DUF916 and DUF3324 domain-containing protein [Vagococcus intermedius]|uniref:DUF916 and DUF3324 domain-containing protein n=1 Tax=Vagococcus intermedius TaxID=2991418 RepID=A0AAF0CV37_9ENTE|nr:DUF916 and DUF3324 domain-containing protein [Vagococcus intermedius]WEG73570.1 DUF916 and DUF3324 domain-containing protein [Vagococcus intermedius]WEG75652.1 DUF916 and DUF3324 domain-containing protein [Vagococcus intermedius]
MKKRVIAVMITFVCLFIPMVANAEGFTISVKPVIPDNQVGDVTGYFNVNMSESEEKTYTIQVSNGGTTEKTVDVLAVNAGTASDGSIDYSNDKARLVPDIKVKFTDLATVPKTLTIGAGETKDLEFKVSTPKDKFPGIVLGSIFILDKGDAKSEEDKTGGMTIKNQMGFPVQMMVTTSEKQVKAELALEKVKVGQHAGHPSLEIPIQNVNPNIIPDLKVTTKIYKKGSDKPIIEKTKEDNRLAPQAIFPYQVQLSKDKLIPGDYQAHIKATSEYGKWEWKRDFTVSNDKAKEINEKTVQKPVSKLKYYLIGGGLLILLIVAYLLNKVRKLSKKVNETSELNQHDKAD